MEYKIKIKCLRDVISGDDQYPEDYREDIKGPYSLECTPPLGLGIRTSDCILKTNSFEDLLLKIRKIVKDLNEIGHDVSIQFGNEVYNKENVNKHIERTKEQRLRKTLERLFIDPE